MIGLTKVTLDRLLKQDNAGDLIALYTFYCYTSKWQNTNTIRCTAEYAKNALDFGQQRYANAKRKLIELKLIENCSSVDELGKKIGWYVRVFHNYPVPTVETHPSVFPTGGQPDHKCLLTGNRNALRTNKGNAGVPPISIIANDKPSGDSQDSLFDESTDPKPKKKRRTKFEVSPRLPEMFEDCYPEWNSLCDQRKEMGKPVTKVWATRTINKLSTRPQKFKDALDVWIDAGWAGFEWDWYDKYRSKHPEKKPF